MESPTASSSRPLSSHRPGPAALVFPPSGLQIGSVRVWDAARAASSRSSSLNAPQFEVLRSCCPCPPWPESLRSRARSMDCRLDLGARATRARSPPSEYRTSRRGRLLHRPGTLAPDSLQTPVWRAFVRPRTRGTLPNARAPARHRTRRASPPTSWMSTSAGIGTRCDPGSA